MNWTEGGLARHSRASKGRVVLLRQKEHFAKARSGLLNSNVKISPPSISFLAHPAASSSSLHRSSKSNNVPGCASSPKKRTRDQDPPHSSQYFQDDTGSNLPTPADFQRHLADEDALRQRRRKLLLKGDWTGTNLQKPIQMEFPKARESHDGPWGLLGSRHARSSKDRQRRMLGIEQGLVQYRGNHHAAKPTRPVSPRHLRVRVGSRERALGGSSNASPRSRTCRDVESSPQVSHSSKSKHRERRRRHTNRKDAGASLTSQTPEVSKLKVPEFYQPVPYRPFLPSLLHSASSDLDDASSTKARVGALPPVVPLSQLEQNEAWWTFVGGLEHESVGSAQDTVQREVSPGISQLGLPHELDGANGERKPVHSSPSQTEESREPRQQEESRVPRRQEESTDPSQKEGSRDRRQQDGSREDFVSSELEDSSLLPIDQVRDVGENTTSRNETSHALVSSSIGSSPPFPRKVWGSEEAVPQSDCLDSESVAGASRIALPASSSPADRTEAKQSQEGFFTMEDQNEKKHNDEEDESEIWKKFVFGEADDGFEEAFLAASKATAKNLCPSDTSATTGSYSPDPRVELNELDSTGQQASCSNDSTAMDSISHKATSGGSSPDPLAEVGLGDADKAGHNATATVSSSSSADPAHSSVEDEFQRRSEAWALVTVGDDNASLVAHPPSTHQDSDADSFKFARPKPFTGRKIQLDEQRQIALSTAQIRGKGSSWRRQKRSRDGRARIRSLPNFNGDPIEEVDEDNDFVPAKNAPKPSLFASLETEDDV